MARLTGHGGHGLDCPGNGPWHWKAGGFQLGHDGVHLGVVKNAESRTLPRASGFSRKPWVLIEGCSLTFVTLNRSASDPFDSMADTPLEAVRAALWGLGEPYASELTEGVGFETGE